MPRRDEEFTAWLENLELKACCEVLQRLRRPPTEAADRAVRTASSPSTRARAALARHLLARTGSASIGLVRLLVADPHPAIRNQVWGILPRSPSWLSPALLHPLYELLSDSDADTRTKAAQWISATLGAWEREATVSRTTIRSHEHSMTLVTPEQLRSFTGLAPEIVTKLVGPMLDTPLDLDQRAPVLHEIQQLGPHARSLWRSVLHAVDLPEAADEARRSAGVSAGDPADASDLEDPVFDRDSR